MSNTTEAVARRHMASIRLLALLVALLTAAFLIAGATTANAKPKGHTSVPITGTADGDPLQGSLDVTRFKVKDGQLMALGTLTATVTDTATGAVTNINEPVAVPVDLQQAAASCEILDLVLGPLDLNLLGLEVHLDQVHLNITAVPGPGNLLGNLLCAVAGLLDGPIGTNGILNQIANLLNQILGALG